MANTTIKITQLPSIGNGLSASTILPVVNTSGTAVTEKVTVGAVANYVLTQAGNTLSPAFLSTIAYSVSNASQPNITSVGTLSVDTLKISGGIVGYYLQTDGSGNLAWAPGGGGNGAVGGINTQVQFNDAGNFSGNTGFTFNKTTGVFSSPYLSGNGNGLSNIQGANVSGTVGNANLSQYLDVSDVNNNFSYHVVLSAGSGDKSLHIDADDNLQYNPAEGILTSTRVDTDYLSVDTSVISSLIPFDSLPLTLGNATNPWQDLYLSNSTIYLGNATISANGNSIVVDSITVTGSNVGTIGNIASLNLDGNSSNILYGNGVFDSIPNPFNQDLNTTDNVTFANITSTDAIRFSNSSNIVGALGYAPTYVSIEGYGSNAVNITANDVYTWTFGDTGNLTLPGNTFSVNYANGVQVSIGSGGNASALVNGNNSFVLDSAGNVVFEGTPSGNAVDRGLVWDYGANANGVNSQVRQDLNGLSVRAWTENAGNYTAPVNIITGQDANTNTWRFDGQGNLTVPSGSINSISDGGDLRAYITLTPDLGLAKLASRDTPANVNYTNTSWISATYTGTQIDFVDAPDLVAFFTNNTFNAGVNQTISINGDEPVPFTGYTIGVSNAVTVYTSVTADPDPTTVTSIDFSSQLESYVAVDYDGGELVIGASGLTIMIDNDQTQGPDINIRSGDDILLQAKDKSLGSESEGGDINIYAGDGADDDGQGNTASTGGDIQITAGNGGDGNTNTGSAGGFTQIYGGTGGAAGVANTAGPGGYVSINGGDGGYDNGNTQLGAGGGYVSINAGLSTQEGINGPNVTITSGQGGPNALAGSVEILTPASVDGPGGTWTFDGAGLLTLPDGAIIDTIGNNFEVRAIENVNFEANAVVNIYTDGSNNAYQWQFGDDGNLTLPGNTFAVNYANGSPVVISGGGGNTGNVTFDNVTVQGVNGLNLSAGSDFTANLAYLQVRAGDVASHIHLDTGNNEAYDLILGDDQNYVQVSSTGNILLSAYDSNTNQYTWTLDYNGNLILAGGNSVIQSIANSSLDILNPNVSTMVLTPDSGYSSQALVLDPTSVGHIHLRSPGSNIDQPSANLFLGGEASSFEVGQYNGAVPNLFIHSNNNTWMFDIDGNLTLPQLTTISDESEIGTTLTVGVPPTVIVISGADFSAVNTTYTKTSATTPTWEPAGYNPATDPYIEFSGGEYGIFAPSFGQAIYVNTGTLNKPLTQWNTNPPLGSVAPTAVYTYGASGPDWVFGDDGLLTLPGGNVTIGSVLGGEAILASNIPFGVVSQGNGSTVLQWIDDISNATALSAIYINSPSGNTGDVAVLTGEPGANANIWTFGNNGNLTLPTGGQIIVSGGLVSSGASPAPSINGFSITNSVGISGNGNIAGNNISATGTLTSTGKIGYSTGGNATQTSTGQGVTVNQLTGLVTLATRTYNAGDLEAFSISCNKVSNDDFVLVQMVDSVNAPSYNVVAYPNFAIANTISVLVKTLETVGTDTPILKFMIVKAPIA